MQAHQVGLELVFAFGELRAQQSVMVVGFFPMSLDEVGIGGGHDGVVGQRSGWIIEPDTLINAQGVPTGVKQRPGLVGEVGG